MVVLKSEVSEAGMTAGLGLVLAARGLASLVGPALAGALRDLTGGYRVAFLGGGGAVLAGGALILPLARGAGQKVLQPARGAPLLGKAIDRPLVDKEAGAGLA